MCNLAFVFFSCIDGIRIQYAWHRVGKDAGSLEGKDSLDALKAKQSLPGMIAFQTNSAKPPTVDVFEGKGAKSVDATLVLDPLAV